VFLALWRIRRFKDPRLKQVLRPIASLLAGATPPSAAAERLVAARTPITSPRDGWLGRLQKHRLKNRFSLAFSNDEPGQVLERLGGRTRARTWDPLIKRHPIHIDISRKFFQLSQNPINTDQWLTAKNPTARARHDWQTDASEAPGLVR
jgi:hypothetical protein